MSTRTRALVAVLCIVVMCAVGLHSRDVCCRLCIGALAFALGWWMAGAPADAKN